MTKEQRTAYNRAYYLRNQERAKANNRAHYAANKSEILAKQRVGRDALEKIRKRAYNIAYRQKNLSELLAKDRQYRAANKASRSVRDAQYRQTHAEQVKQRKTEYYYKNVTSISAKQAAWRKAHPDLIRANNHRRRARHKSASGTEYTTLAHVAARWEMYGHRCWVCGNAATATDHVKPLTKGGCHLPVNLRPICRTCNSRKKDKWPFFVKRATKQEVGA